MQKKKQIVMTALEPTKHHPIINVDNDSDSKFANKTCLLRVIYLRVIYWKFEILRTGSGW